MPNADNTLSVGSASLRWKFYGTLTGSLSKTWKVKLNHDSTQKTYNGSADTDLGTIYAPTSSGTAGYILKSGGANTAPSWIQIVPTANGGTGNTSFTANRVIYSESATKLSSHANLITGTEITYASRTLTPTLRVNSILYADSRIESGDYFLVNKASKDASQIMYNTADCLLQQWALQAMAQIMVQQVVLVYIQATLLV